MCVFLCVRARVFLCLCEIFFSFFFFLFPLSVFGFLCGDQRLGFGWILVFIYSLVFPIPSVGLIMNNDS